MEFDTVAANLLARWRRVALQGKTAAASTLRQLRQRGILDDHNSLTAAGSELSAAMPAGYVTSRRCRRAGDAYVTIYEAEPAGIDARAGRYALVCERHGSVLSVDTIGLAVDLAGDPEWCDECSRAVVG